MSGSLTHSPSDIIRNLLIDLGHGTTPSDNGSWPIYVSNEPNSPDSVITVYDTASRRNGRTQVDGQVQEHHGVQIRVRDVDHDTGFTKSRAIAVALDENVQNTSVTISPSVYAVYAVSRVSGPLVLGKEPEGNRSLFTINVVAALRQTT